MICTDKCRFCSILKGEKIFTMDVPIIEDEDYFLLSSIGAMIEGWSLVIPKKHEFSMKMHYSNSRFYTFINNCIAVIKKAYNVDKVIVFEHGANKYGSQTACGTNHCHIHIVPFSDSLLNDISNYLPFEKTTFDNVEKTVMKSEYLLYADVDDTVNTSDCYIHILKEPTSQFFRRIIAIRLGCPDKYNYKDNENFDISNMTFVTLQKEFGDGKKSS